MATFTWIHDGRNAGEQALGEALGSARAEKLQRMAQIREEVLAEAQAFANDRELMNAVRKRWRQEEQDRRRLEAELRRVGAAVRKAAREAERKPLYVYAQPLRGGTSTEREIKAHDRLIGLPKRSVTKRDGLSSFHCKFTSRGLGSRRSAARPYNQGEAVKHLRYIIREAARELSQGGVVSNISLDPDALAGFFAALEHLEEQDRDNAHVYTSLVISLPHELTPEGRERLLAAICEEFARLGLPHVGVLHAPDPGRDQRNFHTHIMFSLRPFENLGPGDYAVSPNKYSDLNDATFIEPFRHRVAALMNEAMAREGNGRRFTALSDADRGLTPRSKRSGKRTIGESNRKRKQEALVAIRTELAHRRGMESLFGRLGQTAAPIIVSSLRDVAAEAEASRARVIEAMTAFRDRIVAGKARRDEVMARLDEAVARAQPAPQPATARPAPADPARQAAISAAAAALSQASYPPQRRVGGRFQLVPPVAAALEAADWFEAEPIIQQAHQARWTEMVRELETAILEAPRSPIHEENGKLHLKRDGMRLGLHAWFQAASADADLVDLLRRWDLEWKKREKQKKAEAAAAEQEQKQKHKMREGPVRDLVARFGAKALQAVPAYQREEIRFAVRDVAAAATQGRMFVMVWEQEATLFFEEAKVREAAALLSRSPVGRSLVISLAKLVGQPPHNMKPTHTVILSAASPPSPPGPFGPVAQRRDRGGHER